MLIWCSHFEIGLQSTFLVLASLDFEDFVFTIVALFFVTTSKRRCLFLSTGPSFSSNLVVNEMERLFDFFYLLLVLGVIKTLPAQTIRRTDVQCVRLVSHQHGDDLPNACRPNLAIAAKDCHVGGISCAYATRYSLSIIEARCRTGTYRLFLPTLPNISSTCQPPSLILLQPLVVYSIGR